ncbi:MAG: hypothetical protein M0033_12805 [Nitrospiraceae bacterium]|nr:hypothetical protein [Nitrospiraceae bacterium]MDA8327078.1 hypothetical protein [Nitrospiraceae bacterium]
MKKLVVLLMSALLLVSFLSVTGCQKKAAEQPAETAAPATNAPAAPAANAPAAPATNAPAGQ